jgi:monoterpene epsilon-lactone hydrolase
MDLSEESEASGQLLHIPAAPEAIELRHLRSFVAVAEELNFSRAAERLFVTQPALSRQIRQLERLIGVELFLRSTHRVELTVAGEALLQRARPMLTDLDDAVVRTRAVGGENQQRLARLTQAVVDRMLDGLDPLREAYDAMNAQFPAPEGVGMRPQNAGGVPGLVFGRNLDEDPGILLAHGGGFIAGSAYSTRPLAGVLSVACEKSVLVPECRLAPEHPYPAAPQDIEAAFRWLAGRTDPTGITLVGESAGAALVMSALYRLRASGAPLPGRVILMCPWVDLECRFLEEETEADPQALAVRDAIGACVPMYLGRTARDDPAANALHADLAGLPPMLVQAGAGDYVMRDARELVARAKAAGVEATLELYPVTTHAFHLFWSFLPEAAKAVERAGRFVRDPDPSRTWARASTTADSA